MSLLDKLWDDTVAGPQPETGLGRLRRYYTFTSGQSSPDGKVESVGRNARSSNEALSDESVKVTRSIMIIKPPGNNTVGTGSPPISPAGSTPPVSPFSDMIQVVENHIVFVGGLHRMFTIDQGPAIDPEALISF